MKSAGSRAWGSLRKRQSEDRLHMADKEGGEDGGSGGEQGEQEDSQLQGLVSHYKDTATIHGVSQVGGKQLYGYRRCVWTVLLIGMVAGLSTLMYLHFSRYAEFPTVTVVNAHMSDSVPFPAVTICNLNQFRSNRIPVNDSRLRELLFLLSDFAFIKGMLEEKDDLVSLAAYRELVETGVQLKDFAMRAAHTLNDMLKYCVWRTKIHDCEKMFNRTVTDLGVCYTFNADLHTPRIISTDSGPLSGLRVILNIEQDLYYFSSFTQSGIKVLLHEPDEVPILTTRGYFVRPGTCTDVAIRREKTKRLGKPYKAFGKTYCVDTRNPDFKSPLAHYPNNSYTETACWRDCFIRQMADLCGCRHFYDPGEEELCSLDQMKSCYIPKSEKVTLEDMEKCKCGFPCSEVTYSTALSFTDFASKFVAQHMFNTNLITEPNFIRENLIEMRVYYDTLTVNEVEQQPEMTVLSILGNMGGHMGLFLGASILSVTEVVEMVALAVLSCLLGRRAARRTPPATPTERMDSDKPPADSAL